MTISMTTLEAKEKFSELINQVVHEKVRIVLTRRGKEIAAIIPFEDLQLLQQSQDQLHFAEASQALSETREAGSVMLDEFKEKPYHIAFAPTAFQQLEKLSTKQRKHIMQQIDSLAVNPRPASATKLEGMVGLYSITNEALSMIYKVEELEILVLVVKSV